ncbi:VTT domain-containing protein [Plantactinospora sp. S1510]|uniref:VTT domain-containing protein n=1 Tax=Plantactinospora alkalitolerans TaxID=2789879 RepID=A0ABS0H7F1_9ACTN|nr:VTT domain-containing protein [Plantactinospora alkalitolerans]MBF9134037.1 VTT domain-containing protein [Plantactinospora alkalitolerans]
MADWLIQVGELPSVVFLTVLGVVMMLDAIPLLGVLVPGDVAVLAAVGVGRPASVGAFLAVIGGCLGGWSLTFFAGRRFGARLRRSRTGAWIGEARWAAAERMLGSGGGRMVMVAPFLPVLHALLPLAAGGLRMSYRRFVGFAAVGAVLWAGLYMALGTVARSVGGLLPGESFALLGTVAFGMIFGGLVLLGVRRRLGATAEAGPVPS